MVGYNNGIAHVFAPRTVVLSERIAFEIEKDKISVITVLLSVFSEIRLLSGRIARYVMFDLLGISIIYPSINLR